MTANTSVLTDSVQFKDGSLRRTEDGYLVATALAARAGNVQRYLGAELGKPEREHVDVYRPEDEVFSSDTMRSFAHRPLTNDHPDEQVNADNWREHAVGYSGDEVARDGDFLRVPLLMTDAAAIADVESGKRELSAGYRADIEWTEGTTPSGQHYDAIQRNIRNNHIALVDTARGGQRLRIGDRRTPGAPNSLAARKQEGRVMVETQTVVVDGLTIETTPQGAQVIEKLNKQVADAETARVDAESKHKTALDTKDAEIAKKDGEIDELKKKVLSDEDLDKRVAARADLIARARAVSDQDYSGKAEADIRKAAVAAALGDAAVADKSDAYIEARFDMLGETADPVRSALNDGRQQQQSNDNGQAAYEQRLRDGWKGNQKETA